MRFIGCKTLLLDNIKQVIDENVKGAESFCDIFSGTSTVARYFKRWYQVYSNDLLYFSYVLQRGTIQNDKLPAFKKLNKIKNIKDPIDYFNSLSNSDMENLPQEKRFFQNNYAPTGGRMYVNDENALRIDYAVIQSIVNARLGVTPKPSAKYHTVVKGDTLWAIAKKYYGDGNKYPEIARANNIANPNIISVGQKLLIP